VVAFSAENRKSTFPENALASAHMPTRSTVASTGRHTGAVFVRRAAYREGAVMM
jgi:hypothetical protein